MVAVSDIQYPIPLGLAYILFSGHLALLRLLLALMRYLLRAAFVWLQLPASVGVMLSGYFFRHFFQHDLLFARDQLQTHLAMSGLDPLHGA